MEKKSDLEFSIRFHKINESFIVEFSNTEVIQVLVPSAAWQIASV